MDHNFLTFLAILVIVIIGSALSVVEGVIVALQQHLHFRDVYGPSLQRMLDESPIDRDEVRRLAAPGSARARQKAIKYVMTWDPVPQNIAFRFVAQVCDQASPPQRPGRP